MFSSGLQGKSAILLNDLALASGEVILEEDSPLILSGNFRICIHRASGKIFMQLGVWPLAATLNSPDVYVNQQDLMII